MTSKVWGSNLSISLSSFAGAATKTATRDANDKTLSMMENCNKKQTSYRNIYFMRLYPNEFTVKHLPGITEYTFRNTIPKYSYRSVSKTDNKKSHYPSRVTKPCTCSPSDFSVPQKKTFHRITNCDTKGD